MDKKAKRQHSFAIFLLIALAFTVVAVTISSVVKAQQQDVVLVFSMDDKLPNGIDATTAATDLNFNTFNVAKLIQGKLGCHLIRLVTHTDYKTKGQELRDQVKEIMASGKDLHFVNEELNLSSYQRVFIGFPIWKREVPPEMKSFLEHQISTLSQKEVYLFMTSHHAKTDKFLENFYKEFPGLNIAKTLSLKSEEKEKVKTLLINFLTGL